MNPTVMIEESFRPVQDWIDGGHDHDGDVVGDLGDALRK